MARLGLGLRERLSPAVTLARVSPGALRAWVRVRGAVAAGLGEDTARRYDAVVVRAASVDADLGRLIALTVPDWLARVPEADHARYLDLVTRVIDVRPAAATLVCRVLPELLAAMDDAALRPFLAQGLALHGASSREAESFLRRESTRGQRAASEVRRGARLADHQRTLTLYARAHAGEDVEVRAGSGRAFGDGHHVYLPEQVEVFGDARDFLMYRVQTALAVGHLEFGTFQLDLARVPGDWPARAAGESELERFLRAFPNRSLARDLFGVLADARVEARVRAAYPGVARDLDQLGAAARGPRPDPSAPAMRAVEALARQSWGLPPLTLSVAEQRALEPLAAVLDGIGERSVAELAAAVARAYDRVDALMRHVRGERRTAGEPADIAYESMAPSPTQAPLAPEAASAADRALAEEAERILEQMVAEGADGTDARAEARRRARTSLADRRAEEALLDAAPPGGAVVEQKDTPDRDPKAARGARVDPDGEGDVRAVVYPEWDTTIQDYKPAWVRVEQQALREGPAEVVDDILTRRRPLIADVRRRFAALRPEGLVRRRDLTDGDELDMDRVLEHQMERRVTGQSRDRLYMRRDRAERDVAVAFLLDQSSSTNESADGTARRIIDVEKEALIVAAEAIDALGDRFAIWGFSGYGRDHVAFYVAKDFADPWGASARRRVGRMAFRMENRDGAAIRHATALLKQQPVRARILVLLSDGKPLDCGCDHYYDRYAQEDTRIALREARQAGIRPFCITVDPAGPKYLAQMYGEVAFTVIDRVDDLPERLLRVYRRLAF